MMLRTTIKRTTQTCWSYYYYSSHVHLPSATAAAAVSSCAPAPAYSTSASVSATSALPYQKSSLLFQNHPHHNDDDIIVTRRRQQSRRSRHHHQLYRQHHSSSIRQRAAAFSSTSSLLRLASSAAAASRSSSSSGAGADGDRFVPLPPPPTHGTPVFPDVDLASPITAVAERRNRDPGAVFVVTGANRGIGLAFVKTLLATTRGTVMACCRNPDEATALQELQQLSDGGGDNDDALSSRLRLIKLDLADQESIVTCGTDIRRHMETIGGSDDHTTSARKPKIDLLINVAGILGDGSAESAGPERSLRAIQRDWMRNTMEVNCIGPTMLIQELAPLLSTRSKTRDDKRASVVASISARVGSIADNEMGGWYSYRISKAALNQATRTLAHELRRKGDGVWCVALHPGTTDTDLSQPFQSNVKPGKLFPVEFTVNQLLQVIDSLSEQHTGGFYDWAGKSISF